MLDRGFVLDHGKETLATTVIDAEPDIILKMPEDSPWPFITTIVIAGFFTGLLLRSATVTAVGAVLILLCILFWLWPKRRLLQVARPQHG
jgi:cytochrome c oxidase subunit 1/cytochrome c oxidase subunit I+III